MLNQNESKPNRKVIGLAIGCMVLSLTGGLISYFRSNDMSVVSIFPV